MSRHVWIHFVVLVLALGSLAFLGGYFYDVYYLYSLYQKKLVAKEEIDVGSMDNIYSLIAQKNATFATESEASLRQRNIGFPGRSVLGSFLSLNKSFMSSSQSFAKLSESSGKDKASPVSETYEWVDMWTIVMSGANLVQMTGAVLYLFYQSERAAIPDALMGLGCFGAWVSIASYLQISPEYYMMFLTLLKSIPTICKYMVSVMPIFLGCGFLLCCIFWSSEYFVSASKAFYSEFALFLGDIVMDSFARLPAINYVFGNIYVYIFILFFLCVVQNIMLAIISKTFTQDVRTARAPRKAATRDDLLRELAVLKFSVSRAVTRP